MTGLLPLLAAASPAAHSDGFSYETGQGESTGGRKPVMLEIRPNSYYAAGFDIGMEELQMVVADITERSLLQELSILPNFSGKQWIWFMTSF